MSLYISLLNNMAVSFLGGILSASFCNALSTRKRKLIFIGCMVLLPLIQSILYFSKGADFVRHIYPLAVHLPLVIVLWMLTGKLLWSVFSVQAAYLCCELRRWVALATVAAFSGRQMMQDITELVVTIPALLLLLHFVSPAVRGLSDKSLREQWQFGIIPALYYVFDYFTIVYTNLLLSGSYVVAEFMPFVCCVAYLAFLLYNSKKEQMQNEMKLIRNNLDLQLSQAVREISSLRESQTLTRQYRHDMRHHLQYVSTCIENGEVEQAQAYISGICKEIEAQKVQIYCENEAVNLILSSFAGRARKKEIEIKIQCAIPADLTVSESDLCVLLSNALENALHACVPLAAEGRSCEIDVNFYERNKHLFLQVVNDCKAPIKFQNGIPVSDMEGHGIGVQSICAIVQRYGGVFSFAENDGKFTLRLSL